MDRLNKLDVYYHDQKIGTMALYQNRLAAFAYSDEWLQEGFSPCRCNCAGEGTVSSEG